MSEPNLQVQAANAQFQGWNNPEKPDQAWPGALKDSSWTTGRGRTLEGASVGSGKFVPKCQLVKQESSRNRTIKATLTSNHC
jgi:hypothetical protein